MGIKAAFRLPGQEMGIIGVEKKSMEDGRNIDDEEVTQTYRHYSRRQPPVGV